MRLLIDYKPNSKEHIALIELLEIYLFTWDGASINEVGWTVMMLRGRDVLDKWPEEEVTPEIKKNYIDLIDNPNYSSGDFVEFLYLQGDKWSWGRNGSTNAVFLHGETREYFRKYF